MPSTAHAQNSGVWGRNPRMGCGGVDRGLHGMFDAMSAFSRIDKSPTASTVPLQYAPKPRGPGQKVLRALFILLATSVGIISAWLGPPALRHLKLLREQARWMDYSPGPNRMVVLEHHADFIPGFHMKMQADISALLAGDPDWFGISGSNGGANGTWIPTLIGRQVPTMGPFFKSAGTPLTPALANTLTAVVFCHRLRCTAGERLVIVSCNSKWFRSDAHAEGLMLNVDIFQPAAAWRQGHRIWMFGAR